ncbi:MAG: 50S ribosomal protein L17 [Actinomycetota bacterium]
MGSGPAHERLMLSGLAAALFREERIRTTAAKARRLRPLAERLITLGKDGSLHARRRALSVVEDRDIVHKLFAEIAPRFIDRRGGYTRTLKLGPRKGDAAPMVLIELVEGGTPARSIGPEPARRRLLRRRSRRDADPGGRPEEAAASEEADEPEPAE